MYFFIQANYKFRVFPEYVDFDTSSIYRFSYDEYTQEEAQQEITEVLQEVLEVKNCELLELSFSDSHELAFAIQQRKPAHYVKHKIRQAEKRKRNNY